MPAPVRTETVTVNVPSYVALPKPLTTVAPEPAAPSRLCRDADSKPTVCNRDLASQFDAWRAWGRGLAAQVSKIAALQPALP